MRIPGHHQRRSFPDSESMTPMIDVVFLLLVFFVCASIGQKPESLLPAELSSGATRTEVDIPPEDITDLPPLQAVIRLTVDQASRQLAIRMNDSLLPGAGELTRRLRRLADQDPRTRIILDIDDSVSVQQFVGIYDLCQVLKFQSISFAVRQPSG
ncbi:MAG: biopolymer transporter ExbD [Fuerstiella sp.]